jgi:hypothetical protein
MDQTFILFSLTDDNNDNRIIIRPHIVFTDGRQRQANHNTTSVNTICGRIMIGLSLLSSSVNIICCRFMIGLSLSSVSKHKLCLQTNDNSDNPSIIRPHIMFTDGRQQRQPNHNTTAYCVYWRRIMIGLSLSSVSKHNRWSCYDWVVVVVFRLLTQYVVILWLGCLTEDNMYTDNPIIIRPHIVFTDERQRQYTQS